MCWPVPGCSLVASFYPVISKEVQKVGGQTNPKYTRLTSRLLNFEPPLPIKLPRTARPPPCFLTSSPSVSSYSDTIMNRQTNNYLETTHDVTVSERPAFEIGEAGITIRVVAIRSQLAKFTLECFRHRKRRRGCCACILLKQRAAREIF